MPRTIGRRAWFFAVVALVGLLMVIPTPPDFRGAAWFVFALAAFWAVMFAVEDLTAPSYRGEPSQPTVGENPFAPPPAPGRPVSVGRRES